MRKILIAMALAIVTTVAYAEERTTFTDRNGHFDGSAITHGNKTDFYDRRGFYEGTTTRQGTASNPLKGVDGSKPFGPRK
jgi:hypothetical protein